MADAVATVRLREYGYVSGEGLDAYAAFGCRDCETECGALQDVRHGLDEATVERKQE